MPRIVLVDTFKDEAEEALRVAHALGDRLYGIRLDTPSERGRVTADLVHEIRARLDQEGYQHVKIVVSGGLNPDRIALLQGGRRPGRLVRGRLVHQRRHADRLHRRHQGDRRPADRQARPDPRPDRLAAAQAGRPRRPTARPEPALAPRPGDRAGSVRPSGHGRVGRAQPIRSPRADGTARPPTSCSSAVTRCSRRATTPRPRSSSSAPTGSSRGKASILEALGRAYFNSGQHERSRATFERLLELDPSAHYAHYALGQSLKRLGRRERGRARICGSRSR